MGVGDALYLGVADGLGVGDPYGLGVGDAYGFFDDLGYFFVVEVLVGAFSGAVVVDVSVLVVQEAMSPAANMTVME